jgi:hypothetical protein
MQPVGRRTSPTSGCSNRSTTPPDPAHRAELHEARADQHEHGLADDELEQDDAALGRRENAG